jgi:hypothetical protein
VVEIDDRLEHHWASAVFSAVREGDPLAFGQDRLRRARSIYAADLQRAEDCQGNGREGASVQRDSPLTTRDGTEPNGRGELSAIVAELDEAIGRCALSPLEPCPRQRSGRDPRELDAPRHQAVYLDFEQELRLGR